MFIAGTYILLIQAFLYEVILGACIITNFNNNKHQIYCYSVIMVIVCDLIISVIKSYGIGGNYLYYSGLILFHHRSFPWRDNKSMNPVTRCIYVLGKLFS